MQVLRLNAIVTERLHAETHHCYGPPPHYHSSTVVLRPLNVHLLVAGELLSNWPRLRSRNMMMHPSSPIPLTPAIRGQGCVGQVPSHSRVWLKVRPRQGKPWGSGSAYLTILATTGPCPARATSNSQTGIPTLDVDRSQCQLWTSLQLERKYSTRWACECDKHARSMTVEQTLT